MIKQIIITAATGGCLLMAGAGLASADTGAQGASAGSPGTLPGPLAQAPAATATDVCGATLHAAGLLQPLLGNLCGSTGHGPADRSVTGHGAADRSVTGHGPADRSATDATGTARHSAGAASGNVIQLPIQTPVNACGNTVNILGLLNPAGGNGCRNDLPAPHQSSPPPVHTSTPPPVGTQSPPPPQPAAAQLADTGAGGFPVEAPAALALLSVGALLYRRGRRPLSQ